jgi:hypothetical protein
VDTLEGGGFRDRGPELECEARGHVPPGAAALCSQGSQSSQRSGAEGLAGCSDECGWSQEAEHWLDQSFPRAVAPAIPPKDPYLLNVERWPPGIKARCKCFVFPKPSNRRFGEQIVYLCNAARRVADNLALQHAIWLATKLRMPLVVLTILPCPLSARLSSHDPHADSPGVRAYSQQPPRMRSRKEMSQLSALLAMRRALVCACA